MRGHRLCAAFLAVRAAKSNPTVKDCIRLSQKTSKDTCGKEFEINVEYAVIEVVDSLEWAMNCNLKGKEGETRRHQIKCEFETTSVRKDAELLQFDDMGKEVGTPRLISFSASISACDKGGWWQCL